MHNGRATAVACILYGVHSKPFVASAAEKVLIIEFSENSAM